MSALVAILADKFRHGEAKRPELHDGNSVSLSDENNSDMTDEPLDAPHGDKNNQRRTLSVNRMGAALGISVVSVTVRPLMIVIIQRITRYLRQALVQALGFVIAPVTSTASSTLVSYSLRMMRRPMWRMNPAARVHHLTMASTNIYIVRVILRRVLLLRRYFLCHVSMLF